jgi:hypothetical protein
MVAERQINFDYPEEIVTPSLTIVSSPKLSLDDIEDLIQLRESSQIVKTKRKPNKVKIVFAGMAVGITALTGAVKPAAEVITAVTGAVTSVQDNTLALQRADVSTPVYLEQNQDYWQRASVGFTFIQDGVSAGNYKTVWGKEIIQEEKKQLDTLHKDMHMDDVRIGFENENLVNAQGKFDFGAYRELFDEMIKNGMRVTITVGPRNIGWKEFHESQVVLSKFKHPPVDGTVITSESEEGKYSLELTTELFEYLTTNYTPEQLAAVVMVQVGNENDNEIGDPAVRLSQELQLKLITLAHKYFPGQKILLNSAGQLNLESTADTIKKAIKNDPSLQMVEGVDYYLDVGSVDVPLIGPADPFNVPGAGEIDPVVLDKISPVCLDMIAPVGGNKFENAINDAAENKYDMEATEVGGIITPWNVGDYSKGNRVLKLKYALLRVMEHVLPKKGQVVIRLWGVQNWFSDLKAGGVRATETKEMEELVDGINTIHINALRISS